MAIRVKGFEFDSPDDYQDAVKAGIVEKHDVNLVSPNIQTAHGLAHNQNVGGLWANAGAMPDVYHTVVRPESAFLNRLMNNVQGTAIYRNPEFDVLSGVKGIVGNPAANACVQPPRAGAAKLCTLTARFGEINVGSEQVDLTQMDGRINTADVDRSLVNSFVFNSPLMPDVVRQGDNINTTTGLALFRTAITIEREMIRALFQGNNGTASGIFTDEFDGLDQILVANPTDALGNTCGAASSIIVDWSDNDVTNTVNGADIVQTLAGVTKKLTHLANNTSLGATWAIAMDADLFYRLTEIWPCSYLTDGCTNLGTQEELVVDASKQIQMRDQMRTGNYLLINGVAWPVVTTDGDLLGRSAVGAGYSSSIYIVPITALGRAVTYIEGFRMGGPDAQAWMNVSGGESGVRVTNGGLYMITSLRTHSCMEWKINMQPRLICRTPWLGARITSVNYNLPDFAWNRSADPTGQYHLDGGTYYTTGNV